MPIRVTNDYLFTGPVFVSIYTEHEMSAVLDITVEELKSAIARGEYGYHLPPGAPGSGTPGRYQFTERIYRSNIDAKAKRDRQSREDAQSRNLVDS